MSNHHKGPGDLLPELVHDMATLAGASYRRNRLHREKELEGAFENYELVKHDKNHTLFKREKDGKMIVSVSGTNINRKEKGLRETISDLSTDFLLARFGMDSIKNGNRIKAADKFLSKAIDEHGKENVIVVGHSLGGSIAREMGIKHDIESYSFNPGSSPVSAFHQIKDATLDKQLKDKMKKNRTFIVADKGKNTDILSFSDMLNPYLTTHIYEIKKHKNGKIHSSVKGGILESHHINNFKI
jgi:hypothetical protein